MVNSFSLRTQRRALFRWTSAPSGGSIFRPGSPITESGIYEILHERDHRTTHEAVMIAGDSFPECDTCRDRVRFKLVRTAPYIFQDADFEESE